MRFQVIAASLLALAAQPAMAREHSHHGSHRGFHHDHGHHYGWSRGHVRINNKAYEELGLVAGVPRHPGGRRSGNVVSAVEERLLERAMGRIGVQVEADLRHRPRSAAPR